MSTKQNKERKSKKSKNKSKSRSSKKSKKRSRYAVLPSLKPGERSPTKPSEYRADLSLKGMFGYSKKKAVLSNGKLLIEKPNGTVIYVIDLGLSVVAYFKEAKRISINTDNDMFRFKAKTEAAFDLWLEHIRIHRLYRQDKIQFNKYSKIQVPCSNLTPENSAAEPVSEIAAAVQSGSSAAEPDHKKLRKLHDNVKARLSDMKKLIANAESTATLTKEDMINTMKPIVTDAINSHRQFEEKFFTTTPSSELSSTSQPSKVKDVSEIEKSEVEDEDEEASDSTRSITIPAHVAKAEASAPVPKATVIQHRSHLPVPMKEFNLSIWAILKQTIGKDLSRITFPVELFEPLSVLQVLCEELEYSNLLDRAAITDDVKLRMGLVAAFAVSRYSSTPTRVFRKPFNPLEGETFENVREDLGWWYFAEQVSHHPAITGVHAKGKGWEMSQNVSYDLSFWGRSIQAEPKSPVDLVLHKYNETYRWNKVKTSVNNLFMGKRYIDHIGEMIIKGSNKLVCKLTFKKSTHEVNGNGYDAQGKVLFTVDGKWSDSITVTIDGNSEAVWTTNPLPSDAAQYYGFTQFAVTLNELISEFRNVLPPTDSRFRTDQRCLEDGRIDEAREQKNLLENTQRERRKKQNYKPKWFNVEKAKAGGKLNTYRFNNRYWEARKNNFTGETFDELWPAS